MVGSVEEVVGVGHLVQAIGNNNSHAGDGVIRCYVGFEPQWKGTHRVEGFGVAMPTFARSQRQRVIFLADWHAWVNDKFDGDMEAIQTTATYMQETFRALLNHPPEGDGPGQLRFVWASNLMESGAYWARVLRCSKGATLPDGAQDVHHHGARRSLIGPRPLKILLPCHASR